MQKDVNINEVKNYLLNLQNKICDTLQQEDGHATFQEDCWQHHIKANGGGKTRVIVDGSLFEQGGVNFSHVKGLELPASITATHPELTKGSFEAMGVSLVLHPRNPFVPTTHMNVRFFLATTPDHKMVWWFGGGFDLTPYYGFVEDCQHWHRTAKAACDPFGEELYPRFKAACDQYFFLKHRGETRGIGGLFFDYLNWENFHKSFRFMQSVGDHFLTAYLPIVERRRSYLYGQSQRDFQLYRRGRYVEFNLIYDRGTLFGLQFGGRTESILMSLPPLVSWKYNWHPSKETEENKLYEFFLKPQDWLAL